MADSLEKRVVELEKKLVTLEMNNPHLFVEDEDVKRVAAEAEAKAKEEKAKAAS